MASWSRSAPTVAALPLVCERLLNSITEIPLVKVIFDLVELDANRMTHLPYRERRQLLDGLGLNGPHRTRKTPNSSSSSWFWLSSLARRRSCRGFRLAGSHRPDRSRQVDADRLLVVRPLAARQPTPAPLLCC
jgi:hypothetical protein